MGERATSFAETTAECLAVIDRLNPVLRALLHVSADSALTTARAADRHAGDGLLKGVPLTFKDCIPVQGMPTTNGSVSSPAVMPPADAEVVRRARAAGCVILGKNNLSEFCYGGTGENPHFGDCGNPWNPARISGGSSSGSAASVAAGMCRISIGSDTGGSVRVPAAFCGVAGLRPTMGRIPMTGVLPLSVAHDTLGPLAYDVGDVARAFAALAGFDPADPMSADRPVEDCLPGLSAGIAGLRIGIPRAFFFDNLQPAIERAVEAAAHVLERSGARLVDIAIPGAADAQAIVASRIFAVDAADIHKQDLELRVDKIGREVVRRLRLGLGVTGVEYAEACRWVLSWRGQFHKIFHDVDLILTPTTPFVAPKRSDSADMIAATRHVARFSVGLGAAGLPALTVPCGFDEDGMPIGIQLAGPWFAEARVLRAGVTFQAQTDFHRRRPPLDWA